MNSLEQTILRQLFGDKEFADRVAPYIKEKYFHSDETAAIWRLFQKFHNKFRVPPSFVAVRIGLDADKKLNEQQSKAAISTLDKIEETEFLGSEQTPWVIEQTELYCQDRAVFCALQDSIKIMDDPKKSRHEIPELMKEALSVSFDNHIGHDYFAEAMNRYEFYHKPESRLPFDLDTFNSITAGGVPRKTLNVVLAGTNVGKSLALVHFAASYVRMSKNVLYITCEMAEEWIGHRTDANMFDIPMDDVIQMPQQNYESKINFLRQTSTGRLIIKEYPTATAHVGDFRSLLQELRLKQNFIPDVIMVDYLSICASSRVKVDAANSYMFNKFIAEELRGLATEANVPLWTAAQFNREGFKSTDPGLEHVGESFGIPQTADFCVALVSSDELEKLGQIAMIELKNRYNRKRTYQHHTLGFDTPRMKIYELSPAAQQQAQQITLPTNTGNQGKPSAGSFANRKFGAARKPNPMKSLRDESEAAAE